MPGDLQPLDQKFPIVGPDGKPTLYFIKWAQQRQIDITAGITAAQAVALIEQYLADHTLQEGSGISISPSGNLSDSPTIAAEVQAILDQITTTQGSILFRGAADWQALAPGTAGQFLKTNGAGADPEWATGGGGGGAAWTVLHNAAIPNPTTNIPVDVTGAENVLIIAHAVTLSASGFRQIVLSVDGGSSYYSASGDYVFFSDTGAASNTGRIISHGSATSAARTIAGDILATGHSGVLKLGREIGGGRQTLFLASQDPITHVRLEGTAGNLTGGQFIVMAQYP